jgi:oxygen-independent coproporphyrinogen-3 oxidase
MRMNHPNACGDVSLYVHFPYCKSRCTYCDFNTYVVDSIPNGTYTDAIVSEGAMLAPQWNTKRLISVYFGGGTPSLWGPEEIQRVLEECETWFPYRDPSIEITLECNPEEATESLLQDYLAAGVTRVSLGLQSLDDRILSTIGRRHNAERALDALNTALNVGFDSVSADLMFGLPGQSLSRWTHDLKQIAQTGVPHLSMYHLTLEPGTAMTRDVSAQRLTLPPEDEQDTMWDRIHPLAKPYGLIAYEISNLAHEGHQSRHNTSYWMGTPYMGLGAGAHSFLPPPQWSATNAQALRRSSIRNPRTYMERALAGQSTEEWSESIVRTTHLRERMFTGLRYLPGFSLDHIQAELDIDPRSFFAEEIKTLAEDQLVIVENDRIRLTQQGLQVANDVFLRFF